MSESYCVLVLAFINHCKRSNSGVLSNSEELSNLCLTFNANLGVGLPPDNQDRVKEYEEKNIARIANAVQVTL